MSVEGLREACAEEAEILLLEAEGGGDRSWFPGGVRDVVREDEPEDLSTVERCCGGKGGGGSRSLLSRLDR